LVKEVVKLLLVLSMVVPPVIVKVPVPIAVGLLISSWPALRVVPPVNVLFPERVSVPVPILINEPPVPEITPA
jgi:hypothetical protein